MATCALLVRVAACWLLVTAVWTTAAGSSSHLVSVTGSSALAPPQVLPPAAARQKDDYQYDYDDQEDDDYDDYDYDTKKKKKKKPSSTGVASASETNVFNFVRLMIMRLVWGFASIFGLQEPLSEAFNGAFVPPGVDDYGDDGFGLDGLDGDYRDYY